MNLYFFDNFDTDTAGATPAWVSNVVGTWNVVNDPTDAVSSPNVFKTTTHANGDIVTIIGGGGVNVPATADMFFGYDIKGDPGSGLTGMVRASADGKDGYLAVVIGGSPAAVQFYKSVGGSLSTIGSQTTIGITTGGTVVSHFELSAIGTTIGLKAWTDGNTKPSSPNFSITDSSVTAAGYAGFFQVNAGAGQTCDNLTLSGNSSLASGAINSSSVASSSLTMTSAAATGGTGPYTYQWYRATTPTFVPQTANLVSGATSLVLNDTGLSVSTTYYYVLISTDSTGAKVWSGFNSATTTAAAATDFTFAPTSQTTTPSAATGNYTITPNGAPSGSTTVALSDASGGGTFKNSGGSTITSLTFTTATAQTFTYTPSSGAGGTTKTLTASATGGFTASHTASCVVTSTAATGFTLAPSSQTTPESVASGNYTITLNGTLVSNETVALSDAAAGGTFTPSSLTFTSANAGTPQTFTYTPATGQGGNTETLTATATGPFSASHTATCAVTTPPGVGTAFATYVGETVTQLSATPATGGSGTFTLQWFRSTTSGVHGSAIGGATGESVIDTGLTANTDYYYSLQYQDTAGGSPAYSAQVHVTALASSAGEVVGGVGDSIMMGAFSSVETPFNAMIDQLNYKLTNKQFIGVNRAISGTTSVDWSSTSGGSDLVNAVSAFNAAGVTRIAMMLGTNDSKGSVATSTGTYTANMAAIIAYLVANVPTLKTIHLFSSPYQSLSSGDLSVQNCGRVLAYAGALSGLADGVKTFYSQPLASYNLFQNNQALLRDGIHPTDTGDQTMGGLWASNIASDLSGGATVSGARRFGMSGGFV